MTTGTVKTSDIITRKKNSSDESNQSFRLVIYSHDTFGLGHLQRCLKISRALTSRFPQLSVLQVTGSPVAHMYEFPPRVDYVKLPAVKKIGPEKYEPRTLIAPFESVLELRSELVLKSVQKFEPHALLVDHSPVGMKGELRPTLKWLTEERKDTVKILGLRDIIDSPEAVTKLWYEKGIYEVLESSYDHIAIYGMQSMYDPISKYEFGEKLRRKTFFCNYISDTRADSEQPPVSKTRPMVVVTIGGGDGAGETVIGNFIKSVQTHQSELKFDSVIVTGPFMPKEQFSDYQRAVENLPVDIKGFTPTTAALLKQSDLVIATGGYNTITDILAFAKKALVIPRVMHRQEQRLRAKRLAEMGVLEFLAPEDVTPDVLYSRIDLLLKNKSEPVSQARSKRVIVLDGADRLADYFDRIFASQLKPKAQKV